MGSLPYMYGLNDFSNHIHVFNCAQYYAHSKPIGEDLWYDYNDIRVYNNPNQDMPTEGAFVLL